MTKKYKLKEVLVLQNEIVASPLVRYASVKSSCAQHPPLPPPGYCGAFARLVSPGGGNFALPGGRAFPNPGAISELLTRTQFPIRI